MFRVGGCAAAVGEYAVTARGGCSPGCIAAVRRKQGTAVSKHKKRGHHARHGGRDAGIGKNMAPRHDTFTE